jgi:hypothetical protein
MQWALEDLGCTVRTATSVAEVEELLNPDKGFSRD